MESLDSIRYFAEVSRTGSFSEAARRNNLATSSVTRQVDALEAALGVRLLNRSTRRLSLTEAGRLYLEHAHHIVSVVDDGRAAVNALDAEPRGTLRVSAPVGFGRQHIAPRLTSLLTRYPELAVDITLSDQLVDFVEDAIDVAVRFAALPDSSLVARRLVGLRRLICASPVYLERHGTPSRPEDLSAHHCLSFSSSALGDIWRAGARNWRLRSAEGQVTEVSVSGRLQTNHPEVLVQAARDGLGLVLIPSWMVSDCFDDCGLVSVLDDYEIGPAENQPAVYAVYSSTRYLSPKIRAFIDFFHEELKELDSPAQTSASRS